MLNKIGSSKETCWTALSNANQELKVLLASIFFPVIANILPHYFS